MLSLVGRTSVVLWPRSYAHNSELASVRSSNFKITNFCLLSYSYSFTKNFIKFHLSSTAYFTITAREYLKSVHETKQRRTLSKLIEFIHIKLDTTENGKVTSGQNDMIYCV